MKPKKKLSVNTDISSTENSTSPSSLSYSYCRTACIIISLAAVVIMLLLVFTSMKSMSTSSRLFRFDQSSSLFGGNNDENNNNNNNNEVRIIGGKGKRRGHHSSTTGVSNQRNNFGSPPPPSKSPMEKMIDSLKETPDPLKCKKSASLEQSPYLLKKYGPVEENWCEMTIEPTKSASRRFNHLNDDHKKSSPSSSVSFRSASLNTSAPSNGSTFFYYPESADPVHYDWPYYRCPIKHKIRCPGRHRRTPTTSHQESSNSTNTNNSHQYGQPEKKKKPIKALVVFAVTSGANRYQHHQEMHNLNFFIKHGMIPANTPTALFDAVDFVFAKVQLEGEKTQKKFVDCGSLSEVLSSSDFDNNSNNSSSSKLKQSPRNPLSAAPNVKFIMVPKVPCDLCAHSRVFDHLKLFDLQKEHTRYRKQERKYPKKHHLDQMFEDYKTTNNNNNNEEEDDEYSQIIMLNNGIRGPFFESASDDDDEDHENNNNNDHPRTTWVDVATMAGRRKIPDPRLGFLSDDNKKNNKENEEEERDCPIHVSSSPTLSWEGPVHHQSFFLAAPIAMMKRRFFALFGNICPVKGEASEGKGYCIGRAEVHTGNAALIDFEGRAERKKKRIAAKEKPDKMKKKMMSKMMTTNSTKEGSASSAKLLAPKKGDEEVHEDNEETLKDIDDTLHEFAIYGSAKQIYVQNVYSDMAQKGAKYYQPVINPTRAWSDPCKATFVKLGGDVFAHKMIIDPVLKATDRLTRGMMVKDTQGIESHFDFEKIRLMFEKRGCEWKF